MYSTHKEFINISYTSPAKITRTNLLKKLKKYAEKYATGNLMDIGCGIKPYESIFQPYVKDYKGVDYPITMDGNYGNFTKADYHEDCCNTSLRSESYDTILCTQVLEHVQEPDKLIFEANRLLKTGGYAIFTIPFVWEIHAEPYDFFRFTKFGIQALFSKEKFEIISIEPCEGPLATIGQLKITNIYSRKINNIFLKLIVKLINKIRIPLVNIFCLTFDKNYDTNDNKLCLNYVVVAKKINK